MNFPKIGCKQLSTILAEAEKQGKGRRSAHLAKDGVKDVNVRGEIDPGRSVIRQLLVGLPLIVEGVQLYPHIRRMTLPARTIAVNSWTFDIFIMPVFSLYFGILDSNNCENSLKIRSSALGLLSHFMFLVTLREFNEIHRYTTALCENSPRYVPGLFIASRCYDKYRRHQILYANNSQHDRKSGIYKERESQSVRIIRVPWTLLRLQSARK